MVRRAELRPCQQCRCTVWVGLDHDYCALLAYVDVMPLAPLGELLARLAGRKTYRLLRRGESKQLRVRDHHDIAAHPAGGSTARCTYDVLAQHQCAGPVLPSLVSVYALTIMKDGVLDDLPPY